jgi:hypothetical protein
VLFNGITVGDFASWVDSLLVAGLLRFGADSFKKVEDSSPEKQMAFTFQVRVVANLLNGVLSRAAAAAARPSVAHAHTAHVRHVSLCTELHHPCICVLSCM